jgi:hypothetical protein
VLVVPLLLVGALVLVIPLLLVGTLVLVVPLLLVGTLVLVVPFLLVGTLVHIKMCFSLCALKAELQALGIKWKAVYFTKLLCCLMIAGAFSNMLHIPPLLAEV